MKRRDLIKLLEKNGWYLKRNGGNHDLLSRNWGFKPQTWWIHEKQK